MRSTGWWIVAWSWGAVLLTGLVLGGVFVAVSIESLAADFPLVGVLLARSLALASGGTLVALPFAASLAIALDELPVPGRLRRGVDTTVLLFGGLPPLAVGAGALALNIGNQWIYAVTVLAAFATPSLARGLRRALKRARSGERLSAVALGAAPVQVLVHVVWPAAARPAVGAVLRSVARSLGAAAPLLLIDDSVGYLAVEAVRRTLDGDITTAAAAAIMVLSVVIALHGLAGSLERRVRWRSAT